MSSARIIYPETWAQSDRDALDALFLKARSESLWFYHGGLSGPLWFSPDELEAEQKLGRLIWGAVNWTLRKPIECLQASERALAAAQAERDRIAERVEAAGATP